MTILHMDTEQVDQNSRSLLTIATNIFDQISSLRYSARLLQGAWSGNSANEFVWDIEAIANRLENHTKELDVLSRRVNGESQEWLRADDPKFHLSDYYKWDYDNFDLPGDIAKVGGALYIINAFHKISPLRPNSVSIHGTKAFLKFMGFGPHQRIMKPETILKQLKGKGSVLAGLTDGLSTGLDSYFKGEYAGTSRALPAAITDGLVKGVVTGLVTAGMIAAASALTVGMAPIAAATSVIGISVIGGLAVDKFLVDPLFRAWQGSYLHAQTVEVVARAGNTITNYLNYQAQKGTMQVHSAFDNVFRSLHTAMAPG